MRDVDSHARIRLRKLSQGVSLGVYDPFAMVIDNMTSYLIAVRLT
jgi:hypothetical protein